MIFFVSGSKFLCSEVIAPIRSEVDDISLIIINFEDLTAAPAASLESSPVVKPRLSKCKFKFLLMKLICKTKSILVFCLDNLGLTKQPKNNF